MTQYQHLYAMVCYLVTGNVQGSVKNWDRFTCLPYMIITKIYIDKGDNDYGVADGDSEKGIMIIYMS